MLCFLCTDTCFAEAAERLEQRKIAQRERRYALAKDAELLARVQARDRLTRNATRRRQTVLRRGEARPH